ncbi:hypothetical protein ASPWEDRAFT_40171 [Aspergillus wentii DTO 134E9]|uniref:Thioredoxin n=1 Tax=Aspergillus wentii DTO 134E9 TaxID=1073089 RepID=A0A1L9RJC7_ASPWE|nr:uncharacterized protein ASPWEDRAFT_40171 [Aspergillus wentii DTO 134E9]KAI9932003.1 hypothetical protein MW887_009506 [Aspergillus wentii]OJJ35040.1 hypothetical protein ASPWEDRAFT_40171 [Aspergillus wentii DTO 134E9]
MPVTAIESFDDFQKIINGSQPAVINFWLESSGPCKFTSPLFEQYSERPEFAKLKAYKVDVDAQEQIAQEVGVRATPTFIVFKDGVKVGESVGADRQQLHHLVEQAASL